MIRLSLAVVGSFALACGGAGEAAAPVPEEMTQGGSAADSAGPVVRIETSMGVIRAQLDGRAPKSSANFLEYVRDGFYEGTIFHRVIDGFMIQGGGFLPGLKAKPTRLPVELETHPDLTHVDGCLALARRPDPNSANSQFFICDGAQPSLDGQYAVFGKVIEGMDVVRAISAVETGARDVPVEDVVIVRVTVEE